MKHQLVAVDIERATAEPAADDADASLRTERTVDAALDILIGADREERLGGVGQDHSGLAAGSERIGNPVARGLRGDRRCEPQIDYSERHPRGVVLSGGEEPQMIPSMPQKLLIVLANTDPAILRSWVRRSSRRRSRRRWISRSRSSAPRPQGGSCNAVSPKR
jgi:hypothetical protein